MSAPEGQLTYGNSYGESILGVGALPIEQREWSERFGLFYEDGATLCPPEELPVSRALRGESCNDEALIARNPLRPRGVLISVSARPLPGGWAIGVFRDITQSVRHAEASRQNIAMLRQLVAQAPFAIAMFDRKMRYLAWSNEWIQKYNLEESDLAGRSHYEIFPEIGEKWKDDHRRGLAGETLHHDEEAFAREDGRVDYIRWKNVPWRNEVGEVGGLIMFTEVVTEKVENRLLLEQRNAELGTLNEELERLAYIASHDFKAPLRAIRQLAGWVREDLPADTDEDIFGNLDLLEGRVERLETLHNDLLEYLRLARTKQELRSVQLPDFVDDVWEVIGAPTSFQLNIDAPEEPIDVDIVALRQVLLNLIDNAIKHHDRGEGGVDVTLEVEGDTLRGRVCDDGPGIAEGHKARALEMFQTLRPRDDGAGSGVGMALVLRLLNKRGGSLTLTDNTPRGLAVTFALPIEDAPLHS